MISAWIAERMGDIFGVPAEGKPTVQELLGRDLVGYILCERGMAEFALGWGILKVLFVFKLRIQKRNWR